MAAASSSALGALSRYGVTVGTSALSRHGATAGNAALSRFGAAAGSSATPPGSIAGKAKAASEEFEAVFLNTMFNEMFAGLKGDGPFGGAGSSGVWRSFLAEEYAKSFAKAGGVGIGAEVYRTLLAQQEARSR